MYNNYNPWASAQKRIALAVAVATATFVLPCLPVRASDHIDSPTMAQDRGSDIADVWGFLDPNDNGRVVLVLSTQGFVVSGEHFGMGIFDSNLRYRFEIENSGDANPDLFVDVTYSPGVGRLTRQQATITITRANDGAVLRSFKAPTTPANQEPQPALPPAPIVTSKVGILFYAGVADDPFFLDDTGANRFVASSIANPGNPDKSLLGARQGRDTYAGFNTMITALSLPATLLKGPGNLIGINAQTQRRANQLNHDGAVTGTGEYVTVDRQGNPLVNNGLIPARKKNAYNGDTTAADARGKYVLDLTKSLRGFGTDQPHINLLLGVIQRKGDILRLNLKVPNSGPQGGNNPDGGLGKGGGRRLADDVVDATFTIINNDQPMTDFVDANDKPLRDAFPFVADATQPFPPGQGPDDLTRQ